MLYLRWLFGGNLVAVFLLLLIGNAGLVVRMLSTRRQASFALIVGGLAGLLGFLILPVGVLHRLCWLPPLADLTVPYGLALAANALASTDGRARA